MTDSAERGDLFSREPPFLLRLWNGTKVQILMATAPQRAVPSLKNFFCACSENPEFVFGGGNRQRSHVGGSLEKRSPRSALHIKI